MIAVRSPCPTAGVAFRAYRIGPGVEPTWPDAVASMPEGPNPPDGRTTFSAALVGFLYQNSPDPYLAEIDGPREEASQVGPMISQDFLDTISSLVALAKERSR
jgi:hypothetical protein